MEREKNIDLLLEAYLNNTIDERQFRLLIEELNKLHDTDFKRTLSSALEGLDDDVLEEHQLNRLLYIQRGLNKRIDEIEKQQVLSKVKSTNKFAFVRWGSVAAALIMVFGIAYKFYLERAEVPPVHQVLIEPKDILPGTNRAVIRVGNQVLDLDSNQSGITFEKDGTRYNDGSVLAKDLALMDEKITVSIPKGGQYQLTLSDGTKVWLNSESELSYYPFEKLTERKVKLIGEAYFEVAKNRNKPFVVDVNNEKISVLGTQFNVSNYPISKKIVTTLVEGSVQFITNYGHKTLVPNQQSVFHQDKKNISVSNVDVSAFTAWKDGLFDFNGNTFEESLQQIARWYNIDVRYEGDLSKIALGGRMSKGVKLSTFVNYIENNFNLKCEMKSNRILIIKNKES